MRLRSTSHLRRRGRRCGDEDGYLVRHLACLETQRADRGVLGILNNEHHAAPKLAHEGAAGFVGLVRFLAGTETAAFPQIVAGSEGGPSASCMTSKNSP
jgi:hypothetical protein